MGLCSNRSLSLTFCLVGFALCGYAYFVELKLLEDPEYKALCDIDEQISCSKAFNSSYGRGFGLVERFVESDHWLNQPNPVYGLCFYTLMALLALFRFAFLARIQLYLSVLSNVGSVYLAYVLFVILENMCVLCVALYGVNFLLFALSFFKLRAIRISDDRDRSKMRSSYSLPTTSNQFKKNI